MKVNNPPWKQLSWSYYWGCLSQALQAMRNSWNSGGSYFGCLRWLKFWLALFAVKGWESFRWLTLHQGECKKVANTSATGLSKFCSRIYLLRWMQDIVVWAWEAACVLATEDDINELSKFLSVDKVTNLWVPSQSCYRLLCSFCHRAQVCTSLLFYVIMCVPGFSFQYDIRKCNFSYIMLHVCGQRSLFTSSRHANPHHLHMVSCIHQLNHAHCSKHHTSWSVSHHLLICGWDWKHGACNTTTTWIFTTRSYKSVWVPGHGRTQLEWLRVWW